MRFSLFMYCTIGRRAELEAGMAGRKPELYQRMLDEIAEYEVMPKFAWKGERALYSLRRVMSATSPRLLKRTGGPETPTPQLV